MISRSNQARPSRISPWLQRCHWGCWPPTGRSCTQPAPGSMGIMGVSWGFQWASPTHMVNHVVNPMVICRIWIWWDFICLRISMEAERRGDLREDEELTTNLETLARQQVGKNNIISAKIQYKWLVKTRSFMVTCQSLKHQTNPSQQHPSPIRTLT